MQGYNLIYKLINKTQITKNLTTSATGGADNVHVPRNINITNKIGTIHCNSCLSVNLTLCADLTRYVNETLK